MTSGGVWTVVVAGGSARRFGSDKLALPIAEGATSLDLSIGQAVANSDGVVVVVPATSPYLSEPGRGDVRFVAGGSSRSASVRSGLDAVDDDVEVVLVHDAARPLASNDVFQRVIAAVRSGSAAAIPVVPVVDTIRTVDGQVVDRETLRAVQTPQGFRAEVLRAAHAGSGEATDDASLVEQLGHEVVLVDGDVRNLKITRPADLAVARALMGEDA